MARCELHLFDMGGSARAAAADIEDDAGFPRPNVAAAGVEVVDSGAGQDFFDVSACMFLLDILQSKYAERCVLYCRSFVQRVAQDFHRAAQYGARSAGDSNSNLRSDIAA